jgi:hypothetical protein
MRRLPIAVITALILSLVVAAALVGCEANTQASGSDKPKADAKPESSKEEAIVQSAMMLPSSTTRSRQGSLSSKYARAPTAGLVFPTGKPRPATIPSASTRRG